MPITTMMTTEAMGWRAFHETLRSDGIACGCDKPDCTVVIPSCVCGRPFFVLIGVHRPSMQLVCVSCGPQLKLRLHDDTSERAAVAADVARQVEELAHGR